MNDFFATLKVVVMNKSVLITAVCCILAINFANYVAKYRKKPPHRKMPKVHDASTPASAKTSETEAEDSGEYEYNDDVVE